MKKKTSLFLIILLTFSVFVAACGKDAEIICGNCGATAPGDSLFCPECGTAFFQSIATETTAATAESTESTTSDNTSPTTETEGTTTPAPETEPTQAIHTHSYFAVNVIPATCTTQGYTTYACTCGDSYNSDYVDAGHAYTNYQCVFCGAVDKAYAYEYLCCWIIQYGTHNENLYRLDIMDGSTMFSLIYDTKNMFAYVSMSFESNGEFFFSGVWLESYSFYTTLGNTTSVEGYLNPGTFTANSSLSVSSYVGDASNQADFTEVARLSVCDLLDWLEVYLYNNNMGITLSDLGFAVY